MTLDKLLEEVMLTFSRLLRENPYELNLKREEVQERLKEKGMLRRALRTCVHGDRAAKCYVKDYIKDMLVKKFKIDQDSIQEIVPFSNPFLLSGEDKFRILLYVYTKDYQSAALEHLIEDYQLALPKSDKEGRWFYEITEADIHSSYDRCEFISLSFVDKLNILTQRIYERYKGNGVIDEIRDMKIDGISTGVSGIPESFRFEGLESIKSLPASYDSIWIFYHGKSVRMSFLSFGSNKELIRVCRNIYRYNNPEQLSESKGYTVNEMKDGARVAVARPPFCESWVLFIRKFDSVLQENIHNLITDENSQLPITLMKWLIKGCMVTGITGQQGSGKTTLLMALIGFIDPVHNLRIQELSFELHLRRIYPERNIVTFREVGDITGRESLDYIKKTDGSVTILGEVATDEVSVWLIKAAQVASLFTLFTHHAKTTENLIISMRNALLMEGGFQNERIAQEQAVSAINFDIHMKKDDRGHRYIERITEIVPDRDTIFKTRDIVRWQNGFYQMIQPVSGTSMEHFKEHLTSEEISDLCGWMERQGCYV